MRDGWHMITILRCFRSGAACTCVALVAALPVDGQASPQDDANHHQPGQGTVPQVAPMKGMEGMMSLMRGNPPKELYPSMMNLPDLSPDQREEVRARARARLRSGVSLLSEGTDRLTRAVERDDPAAMQEATGQMREGLALFESGVAAQRALAEGRAPRDVALQWFKQEMNLAPAPGAEREGGPFGLSWLHFAFMVVLIGFAGVMVWMHCYKMRRAAELLQRLTAKAPSGAVNPPPATERPSAPAANAPPVGT